MPTIIIPYLTTLNFHIPDSIDDVNYFSSIGPMPYRGLVLGFRGDCSSPGSGAGQTQLELLAGTRAIFNEEPYFDPNTTHPLGGYILEGGSLVDEPSFAATETLKLNVTAMVGGFDVIGIRVAVLVRLYEEVQV